MEALNDQVHSGVQEREVTLQDYIRIIYRSRWLIFFCFIIVMALTVYITFTAPPQYQASTLILLTNRTGSATTLFQNPIFSNEQTRVNNEIEVLKSISLARRVINSLRRSPAADSLYLLGTKKITHKGIGLSDITGGIISGVKKILFIEDESNLLFGSDSLDRPIVKSLQQSIKIEPVRMTEAVRITVSAYDPKEAALIANTVAQEYYNLDLAFNRGEVVEMKNFLEEQLADIEQELKKSEEALRQYQEKEGIFGLDETAKILIDQLSTFEANYYTTLADLKITKESLDNQQKMLTEREQMVIKEAINTTNPLISQIRQAIAEFEAEKITIMASQGYGPNHEAIRELDKRIKELKDRLFVEAEKMTSLGLTPEEQSRISAELLNKVVMSNIELIALEAKSKEYKQLVDQYAAKLNRLPENTLQYARLDRERQVNEKYYMLMKTKYQESRITEASKISNIRIVDPAIPPEKPFKPKKRMNLLLGLFLGFGLGVGLAFIRDYLDHSIKSGDDLQRLGLTTLAIVPTIDIRSAIHKMERVYKGKELSDLLKTRLISHYDPKSAVAEAYRTLRTNIQFMSPDKPIRSLIVSSAGPGDGKSTTVINIAITFASLGKKTVLIDTDLRKPILHKVFDYQRGPGLTQAIIEEIPITDVIRHTDIPNLDLITCGDIPPNPSELLGSQKFINFVEQLKEMYEIVLFDSPPVIAVTDASVLSKLTDAMVLVVRAGGTDLRALNRAVELLTHVKANLIGVVLNGVNLSAGYDSYYYYYRYYYYYSDSGLKKKSRRIRKRHEA